METKSVTRRRHSRASKAEVLAACSEPGASVAAIAMAHGLNANLVHRWRKNGSGVLAMPEASQVADGFIALTLPASTVASKLPDIRIELRRGPTTVTVNWPMAGAGECGLVARLAAMIRIEAVWLSTSALDMRAGTDTALARVVMVFGSARPHQSE